MKRITKYDKMLNALHINRKKFFAKYKISKARYYKRLEGEEMSEKSAIKLMDAILKHQDLMEVNVDKIMVKN